MTTDHPIFDPDARGFFPAGDWLLGARSGLLVSDESGVRRESILKVERFTRVDEVFDLTVEHAWHTFVAEGVVVHNKSPPCGPIKPNTTCSCGSERVGVLECESTWGSPVCVRCHFSSDGGMPDARIDDAGVDDGGTNDGGTNDGGTNDGGSNDAGNDGG